MTAGGGVSPDGDEQKSRAGLRGGSIPGWEGCWIPRYLLILWGGGGPEGRVYLLEQLTICLLLAFFQPWVAFPHGPYDTNKAILEWHVLIIII